MYAFLQPFQNQLFLNPLSVNSAKWSDTLKQFVRSSQQIVLEPHFVGLAFKRLSKNVLTKHTYVFYEQDLFRKVHAEKSGV